MNDDDRSSYIKEGLFLLSTLAKEHFTNYLIK